ncbi:chemotaxis protein CheA [Paenibacillus sp. UNC499MF]|uniref:chemotaxis protein CheA n=1 Tax=Paenibacillus sp. UNC499MF TaxID=1502751 RepID=UPI0008A026C0|nr:chemotaxis protein CheA [Paenibacillus sp. UNC499MF]SEG64586.1 P2 response regulator binding domain-containing protein [Paenibacillus sp. UNC499MF]
MLSEYREIFLEELEEQLQVMDGEILKLEQSGESGIVIQSLFRAAHTIKGSSAAMGFEEMKQLTHEMEHLLDRVRSGQLAVSGALVDLLFTALDILKQLKQDIVGGEPPSADISDCVRALRSFGSEDSVLAGDRPETAETPARRGKPSLSLDLELRVQERMEQGQELFWVDIRIASECLIRGARAYVIHSALNERGDVLLADPEPEGLDEEGPGDLLFLYAGKQSQEELQAFADGLMEVERAVVEPLAQEEAAVTGAQAARDAADAANSAADADAGGRAGGGMAAEDSAGHAGMSGSADAKAQAAGHAGVSGSTDAPAQAAGHAGVSGSTDAPAHSTGGAMAAAPSPQASAPPSRAAAADAPAKAKSPTIRVSVERLEHLMNLVGELVIDQTRIHQVERTQRRRIADESVDELGQIADHLSRIIGDLQESVMKTRMLPIEQLFNRFPRMIRDLSRMLGKEIELVLEGKDTELDRTLIEEIADPLIHLIRNAVDHGIEKPEIRTQSGKSAGGVLTIRAAHEDNQVVIYVQDDGAGIDPARMIRSALEKGIISREEAEQLSEREAVELIFRPGFSTASTVSDVSGRGVGMDIVRSHIEKLNGLIDIETRLGRGTCFKIKLPLTLAIIVGLQVKLGGRTFIVPMSNIAEIVRVSPDDIRSIRGQSVIVLRNQVIPVARLHDYLQIPYTENTRSHIPLVIVGSAEKRLALVVDELIGNQEIVIKSLGPYIGKVDGIAGATILGDGNVALILEIASIIGRTGVRPH